MSMLATTVYRHVAIPPGEGEPFSFGNVGGQFKIGGGATDERFAVAQLPEIPPFTLAAPLHRHHEEDEYTYVVAGRLGAIAGGEVMIAEAGTWLVKPRGEWHTFWNPGDEPCNLIEIVSPAGFESYFQKVADSWGDLDLLVQINEEYSIDTDFDSVPKLCERYGLAFPEMGG